MKKRVVIAIFTICGLLVPFLAFAQRRGSGGSIPGAGVDPAALRALVGEILGELPGFTITQYVVETSFYGLCGVLAYHQLLLLYYKIAGKIEQAEYLLTDMTKRTEYLKFW